VYTEEQAQKGLSLREQERRCKAQATALNHKNITVYKDKGYSGKD